MVEATTEPILAVDDNPDGLYALERILKHNGYKVLTASSAQEAFETAKKTTPGVILLDVMMPLEDGYEATKRFKADSELRFVPVILVTAKDTLQDLIYGLDNGADGYITKPFKPEELLARVRAALRMRAVYTELMRSETENTNLKREITGRYDSSRIVGDSPAMNRVFDLLNKVAKSSSPVLVTGPSGTGKELIARALHSRSDRSDFPFVAKNCAAFSEHLLESELFGHVRGSFTGALKDQKGLFEAADHGTLFLDEIGEMPQNLQAKLLRVLQEGTFTPVGSTTEKRADVRIVAATNRNLEKMVEEGKFREDLFYRLNVINIKLPSLAERPEDIVPLAEYFLERGNTRSGQKKYFNLDVKEAFRSYQWRGNVRELENEIERMLILSGEGEELTLIDVSPNVLQGSSLSEGVTSEVEEPASGESGSEARVDGLKGAVERLERELILSTLIKLNWNKSSAAKELGISRSSLLSKIQQFGLER